MNKRLLVGIVVVIIVILGSLYFIKPRTLPPTQESTTIQDSFRENTSYCFVYIQKSTPDAPYAVEEHMSITRTGNSVTGTKSGTQSGPDMTNGYIGSLNGEITSDKTILELLFTYTIEGSEGRELEIYKIDGENLLKQRYMLNEEQVDGNGVLVPDRTGEPTSLLYKKVLCN